MAIIASVLLKQQTIRRFCSPRFNLAIVFDKLLFHSNNAFSTRSSEYVNVPENSKNNIILMGSPGSGKTTVGRLLGDRLCKSVIDIDNDFLESHWGMPVASKLNQVGSSKFVDEEGSALLSFQASDAVISLTGSNPMHKLAMDYIKTLGTVIFLDVQSDDILQRLERMKVNRIVGQTDNMPMSDILPFRQQFYEDNYDIRVLCEQAETPDSIVSKIEHALDKFSTDSGFVSTRQKTATFKSFNDVVLEGLASDGGLYIPANNKQPTWTLKQWDRLVPLNYEQRALRILETWIPPHSLHPRGLATMLKDTYNTENFDCNRIIPVIPLQDNQFLCELFHGPTASFKDAALQLMPKFFLHALQEAKRQKHLDADTRYLILVATSGDTGGAVLYGFNKLMQNYDAVDVPIQVMVLYPSHGISNIQRLQMTTVDGKALKVIGIESDFDFCQTSIKQIFGNKSLNDTLWNQQRIKLSAANSINWGRLLPQVVYHASAYLDMVKDGHISMGDEIDVCIPTGNFGNILAAYYAKQMGIPFARLICASNNNNILTEFFTTGIYDLRNRSLKVTASPAIDILRSSNLERFLCHLAGPEVVSDCYSRLRDDNIFQVPDWVMPLMKELITADSCTESESLHTIQKTFEETGYVLDPHTAVAKVIADRHANSRERPLLISSTAHPAKFADTVLDALGQSSDSEGEPATLFAKLSNIGTQPLMHEILESAIRDPVRHKGSCAADVSEIEAELWRFVGR